LSGICREYVGNVGKEEFIVDAQLPYQLALFIRRKGFEAIENSKIYIYG